MQTKPSILLVTIVVALSITILTLPVSAVGEEGTGTLYVYTDLERTTLAPTDAEDRYVTVPGVEYYFKVSGITEYNIGTTITIWVYRTATAENIEIGKFEVNSVSFDAIFTWTIPEDWLDEVVKIKYGTNLENDWLFAKKDIWVNARVGTGILKAYTDPSRTVEAPLDSSGNYLVYPEATYYFRIDGITEYTSTTTGFGVWAHYKIGTTTYDIGISAVWVDSSTIDFYWEIPDLPISTSIKFKYGTDYKGPLEKWVYARRETMSAPRLLLVIPEVFLGSLGASIALFSGLGIKTLIRRKRT